MHQFLVIKTRKQLQDNTACEKAHVGAQESRFCFNLCFNFALCLEYNIIMQCVDKVSRLQSEEPTMQSRKVTRSRDVD